MEKLLKPHILGKWEEADMLIFVRIPESSSDLERKIQEHVVIHVNREILRGRCWKNLPHHLFSPQIKQQYGFN